MSRLAARIVWTIFLFPAGVLIAIMLGGLLSLLAPFADDEYLMIAMGFAMIIGFCYAFYRVWRGVVAWTPRRKRRAQRVSVIAIGVSIAGTAALLLSLDWWDVAPWLIVCNAFIALVWLFVSVRVWQESPTERTERISAAGVNSTLCPACKYDLSGLTYLRCPECGNQFTLGQLQDEQRRRLAPPGLD